MSEERGERRPANWGQREIDRYIEEVVWARLKSLEQAFEGFVSSAESRLQEKIESGFTRLDTQLEAENIPERVKELEGARHRPELGLVVTCLVLSAFVAFSVSLLYDLRIAQLWRLLVAFI